MSETFDIIRKKAGNVFVKVMGGISLETAEKYLFKFYTPGDITLQTAYSIAPEDPTWEIRQSRILDRKSR